MKSGRSFIPSMATVFFAFFICALSQPIPPIYSQGLYTTGLEQPSEKDLRETKKFDPDQRDLPPSINMEKFIPPVGDQGTLGSCASWAGGYYLATNVFAQWYEWPLIKAGEADPQHVMSPAWVYRALFTVREKTANEQNAKRKLSDKSPLKKPRDIGLNLLVVGKFLEKFGSLPFDDLKYNDKLDDQLTNEELGSFLEKAKNFKLPEVGVVWARKAYGGTNTVLSVKAALNQGSPIMIGACPTDNLQKLNSHKNASGRNDHLWFESKDVCVDALGNDTEEGHALTLVGYDDTYEGGAFRFVNSWGSAWGDQGYGWISYKSFPRVTRFAVGLIEIPDLKHRNPNQKPRFIPRPNTVIIPGENAALWLKNWKDIQPGDIMPTVFAKLGGPSNVEKITFMRGQTKVVPMAQTWIYSEASGAKLEIEWENGVVSSVSFSKSEKNKAADPEKVERNWNKISLRMRAEEVLELIGGTFDDKIQRNSRGEIHDYLVFAGPDQKYRLGILVNSGIVARIDKYDRWELPEPNPKAVSSNWRKILVNDGFPAVIRDLGSPRRDPLKWYGLSKKGFPPDGRYIWAGEDGLFVEIQTLTGFVEFVIGYKFDPQTPAPNPELVEQNWTRIKRDFTKATVYKLLGGPDGENAYVDPDSGEPIDTLVWKFSPKTGNYEIRISWHDGRVTEVEKILKAERAK